MQAEAMTPAEKYLFDIHGYVIIEELLSAAEVEAANAAVNAHSDEISIESLGLAARTARAIADGGLSSTPVAVRSPATLAIGRGRV